MNRTRYTRSFLSGAFLICCFGSANLAQAGLITGNYQFAYVTGGGGTTADGTCTDGFRDHFSGLGSNTIGGSDTISFSACNHTPGALVGGLFTIDDGGGNLIGGTFSGTDTGTTVQHGDNFYNVDDGTFQVVTATGTYAGTTDGTFEADTGLVGSLQQGSGFLDLTNAPEPMSFALIGSGIFVLGLLKRRNRV